MGLESNPQFISDLNAAWPLVSDPRIQGTNHFQCVKYALQNTFPAIKGQVTASHTTLNTLGDSLSDDGVLSANAFRITRDEPDFTTAQNYLTTPSYRFVYLGYMPRSGGSFSGPVSVPAVSDWTTNQVLGTLDGDGRYLRNYAGDSDATITRMAYRPSAGAPFIDGFAGGPFFFQRQGDYATNASLNAVAENASNAVSALANSANTAASKNATAIATKLTAVDGTATRLTIDYGSVHAQFQSDSNFVMYQGTTAYFSISPSSISWNGHNFVFQDTNVLPAGRRMEAFNVSTTDGSRVNFPNGFSSDDNIVVQLTAQRNNNRVVVASWENVDRNGFTIGLQREDTNGASQQTSPWTVSVTAVGNQ